MSLFYEHSIQNHEHTVTQYETHRPEALKATNTVNPQSPDPCKSPNLENPNPMTPKTAKALLEPD